MFDFLKSDYIINPIVQFNESNKPCICGCKIIELDSFFVRTFKRKTALQRGLIIANEKYPQYDGYVQLE